jgi:hypothetical protein
VFAPKTEVQLKALLSEHDLWNADGFDKEPHLMFEELITRMYSEMQRAS